MIPHLEREKKLEEATKIQQDIFERLKADLKMATNTFRPAPQGPSSQRVRFQEQNSDLDQEPLKPRTAVKTQTCIGLSWTWSC
jgi:hypothetical protein